MRQHLLHKINGHRSGRRGGSLPAKIDATWSQKRLVLILYLFLGFEGLRRGLKRVFDGSSEGFQYAQPTKWDGAFSAGHSQGDQIPSKREDP